MFGADEMFDHFKRNTYALECWEFLHLWCKCRTNDVAHCVECHSFHMPVYAELIAFREFLACLINSRV